MQGVGVFVGDFLAVLESGVLCEFEFELHLVLLFKLEDQMMVAGLSLQKRGVEANNKEPVQIVWFWHEEQTLDCRVHDFVVV